MSELVEYHKSQNQKVFEKVFNKIQNRPITMEANRRFNKSSNELYKNTTRPYSQ